MIHALITLTVIFAGLAVYLTAFWPVLHDRRPAAPKHTPKHASAERIHAGGRYTARMPRRDAPPLTEQAIITTRPGRPDWNTAPLPRSTAAYPCCEHCTGGSPCNPRNSHRTPCADGCNDVNTNTGTLKLYERGNWGTMPEKQAAEAERLARVMQP